LKVATILALAVTFSVAQAQEPLMSHAKKALANKNIRPWERAWYEKVVSGAVKPKHVKTWSTQYGLWNKGRYKGDTYHIACNKLPKGTVVWMTHTQRLMVVTNCGASSNDGIAQRQNGQYWTDVWTKYRGQYGWDTKLGSMWILGKAPWRH
jgi:hypothetical protein